MSILWYDAYRQTSRNMISHMSGIPNDRRNFFKSRTFFNSYRTHISLPPTSWLSDIEICHEVLIHAWAWMTKIFVHFWHIFSLIPCFVRIVFFIKKFCKPLLIVCVFFLHPWSEIQIQFLCSSSVLGTLKMKAFVVLIY